MSNGVEFVRIGMAHTIAVNRPEVDAVVRHLDLPSPSALSPLPGLAGPGARGAARDIGEIVTGLGGLAPDVARWAFSPLSAPDRILDARAAVFNAAPTPCRLYGTRAMPGMFAAVRPAMAYDYELLAPFSVEDLEVWVRLGLQLSGGQSFPLPARELTGQQLTFLLALADAFKLAMARGLVDRSADPRPLVLTLADLLDAQRAALAVRDRRWALCAVGELVSALVHPGGATGVGLPALTEQTCREEIRRLARDGYVLDVVDGAEGGPRFRPGPTLSMFASTLLSWLAMVSLHDVQVTAVENGRARAQEELILFVATDATIWALVSEGLAKACSDLSAVRFGLRSIDVASASALARDFLAPLQGVSLPEELYAPAPAGVAPTRPAAAPRAWRPSHRVPVGGLYAWEAPDPTRDSVALEAGVEVLVAEELGEWARVVRGDGWTGWVEARALEPI